ncbi:MAG: helix-turn-helix transcriptional regulator [Thermomicrobiales bacterium]|nr:helix-turn-helix transcriptional regulator [Thermomicrobiales bacterium]
MSIVSAELSEAWTLRRRSGAQMARPATTYRVDLDLEREFQPADAPAGGEPVDAALHPRLTHRELQVIQLAARGATDREIADALFISRRTVTSHMASILFKLNVGNRTAAAVIAAQSGLI